MSIRHAPGIRLLAMIEQNHAAVIKSQERHVVK